MKKKGGGRHCIVKCHSLVWHVKILWTSEKRHALWSIIPGTCNLTIVSPATEGKVLIIKAELVGFRISAKIGGLDYWLEDSTGHVWIEVYGNFSSLCTGMNRASVPPPSYASLRLWVSKQNPDGTEAMRCNQHPYLRFNTHQLTPLSTELPPTLTSWYVVFGGGGARHERVTAWRAITSTSSTESTTLECGMSDPEKRHLDPTCTTQLKAYPAHILVEKCVAEDHTSRLYHLMSYRMDVPQPCIEKNHAYPIIEELRGS